MCKATPPKKCVTDQVGPAKIRALREDSWASEHAGGILKQRAQSERYRRVISGPSWKLPKAVLATRESGSFGPRPHASSVDSRYADPNKISNRPGAVVADSLCKGPFFVRGAATGHWLSSYEQKPASQEGKSGDAFAPLDRWRPPNSADTSRESLSQRKKVSLLNKISTADQSRGLFLSDSFHDYEEPRDPYGSASQSRFASFRAQSENLTKGAKRSLKCRGGKKSYAWKVQTSHKWNRHDREELAGMLSLARHGTKESCDTHMYFSRQESKPTSLLSATREVKAINANELKSKSSHATKPALSERMRGVDRARGCKEMLRYHELALHVAERAVLACKIACFNAKSSEFRACSAWNAALVSADALAALRLDKVTSMQLKDLYGSLDFEAGLQKLEYTIAYTSLRLESALLRKQGANSYEDPNSQRQNGPTPEDELRRLHESGNPDKVWL